MATPGDVERDLQVLEAELRKLEAEYNMFFAGQLPKPPWETRARVDRLMRRYDKTYFSVYAERFRFGTLQARYATFVDLWERGLRAREEGRPGPFGQPAKAAPRGADRILHVTTFHDPLHEIDRVHELYDRLVEARREVGEEAVPFHKFVQLLQEQVRRLRRTGTPEVAFRLAVREGKVNFTARALKGIGPEGE